MIPSPTLSDEQKRSQIAEALNTLQHGSAAAASRAIEILYSRTEGEGFATAVDAVDQILTSLWKPDFSSPAMGLRYICDVLRACNADSGNPIREQYTTSIRRRVDEDLALLEGFVVHADPIAKTSATFIAADRERNRTRLLEIADLTLQDEEPIVKASSLLMLGQAFPAIQLDQLLPNAAIPAPSPVVDAAIANTLLSPESNLFPRAVAAVAKMLKEGERFYVQHFLFKDREEFDFQGQFPWFESYFRAWLYKCACREQYHKSEPIAAMVRKIIESTNYTDDSVDVYPIVCLLFPERRKLRPLAEEPVLQRSVLEALVENEDFWPPAKLLTESLLWFSKDEETLTREELLK